ncbi:MAG: hypothetical protein E7Z73_07800 [Methanobrevibacter millerae]|uniref:Uncharacterized protein n=1 Tax=Methanobrevibacter millerae TaxID=230361 RepID=A0A8T3VN23_9EURY|nr:hypothetical protein [Methanobrevibacter millerae]MBE6505624.1 hypothetical protein [Methanobrevibacter millerae]
MSSDSNIIGNGSSVFKVIGLLIAGYIVPIVVAQGINLNGQETQITQILGIIIATALSYIDMKYANSFFKRNITLEDYIRYGEKNFGLQTIPAESDCEDCTCGDNDDIT